MVRWHMVPEKADAGIRCGGALGGAARKPPPDGGNRGDVRFTSWKIPHFGALSNETTRVAPRSSSISLSLWPTKPLPPVTRHRLGTGIFQKCRSRGHLTRSGSVVDQVLRPRPRLLQSYSILGLCVPSVGRVLWQQATKGREVDRVKPGETY